MIVCNLHPARQADAPAIAAMSRRFIESGLEPSWPAERVLRHIRHADSIVLTAKSPPGELLGFAIMQFGDDTAHLNLLAVDPAHRRLGIARSLLGWLDQTALVAGTFRIGLELRAGNERARAFYEALGYVAAGRVPGYYQGIEDAICMMRDLRVAAQRRS